MVRGKVMRSAAVAMLLALPGALAAEGHTSEFVGNKGYTGASEAYGAKGYVPPAGAHAYHAPRRAYHKVRRPVKVVAVPPCPLGYTGMYRGTLYCIEGKLVH